MMYLQFVAAKLIKVLACGGYILFLVVFCTTDILAMNAFMTNITFFIFCLEELYEKK